jgi:hypothetical protein
MVLGEGWVFDKRIYLGTFNSEQDGIKAYNDKLKEIST